MTIDQIIIKLMLYTAAYELECDVQKPFISVQRCPRCGENHMPGETVLAATSHISAEDMDIYICNECALPDKKSRSVEDFKDWAIADENFIIE